MGSPYFFWPLIRDNTQIDLLLLRPKDMRQLMSSIQKAMTKNKNNKAKKLKKNRISIISREEHVFNNIRISYFKGKNIKSLPNYQSFTI
jgi:hypothetical protein